MSNTMRFSPESSRKTRSCAWRVPSGRVSTSRCIRPGCDLGFAPPTRSKVTRSGVLAAVARGWLRAEQRWVARTAPSSAWILVPISCGVPVLVTSITAEPAEATSMVGTVWEVFGPRGPRRVLPLPGEGLHPLEHRAGGALAGSWPTFSSARVKGARQATSGTLPGGAP